MALMNPKDEEEQREEEEKSRMQTDVTDEEMALRYERTTKHLLPEISPTSDFLTSCFRYETLVGSMKKKFAKKRERAALDEDAATTKRAFLKPQD